MVHASANGSGFGPHFAGAGVGAWRRAAGPGVQDDIAEEDELDDALDDSFPASDPPAPAQPHPDRWYPPEGEPAERAPADGGGEGGRRQERRDRDGSGSRQA